MSDHASNSSSGHVSRRGVMKMVGITGVGAAAAMFARPGQAQAVDSYGCCNLLFPPNTSYSYCAKHAHTWGCSESGGFLHCNCCSGCGMTAYKCQYGGPNKSKQVRFYSQAVGAHPKPRC